MDNWQYHDKKMKELKQLYLKTSKQTQNKLQEIIDTFKFDFNTLYNIADKKIKNRVNTYIEELKDKELLIGYFGILAKNIYSRTRVKNSEILELLIYGAYIEEQNKIQEQELNIMYDDVNYYYQQGQQEVNNALPKKERKPINILNWAFFLALLDEPNVKGYVLEQYVQATIQFNSQQIYRQMTIDLQQQNEIDITNDIYQNIIKRQNNSKLNINGDKISGNLDEQLIGVNNLAKLEGIKEIDDNAQVRFVAIIDGKETDMCHSLNNQLFYINKENTFDRYYGETQSELRIQRVRCKGLVLGLNLPPISHHFHWCRSTITYQVPVEKQEKSEYNLDIPKISKDIKPILNNTKLNNKVKKLFNRYLTRENTEIDNNLKVPMQYSINDDKILINPNHPDFKYYDLAESLTHEIVHMIDTRNNISDNLNIDNELRRVRLSIDIDEDKYVNIFKSKKYENNMSLSDIFSAVTNGKITGNYGHGKEYWLKDIARVEKELSADIMSAYLNNDEDTLKIIDNIEGLRKIKEKVVNKYDEYTR